MKVNKNILIMTFASLSMAFSNTVSSDQVILDDLIVTMKTCVGADCIDGELFDFESLKLKSDNPQILFDDTSTAGSFPRNDWLLGITDNAGGGPAEFFIKNVTADINVMVLGAGTAGGVALGAGSTVEPNAISVGSIGNERRIMHVADGVNSSDAITMSQFAPLSATLNARIDAINTRMDDILARISKL